MPSLGLVTGASAGIGRETALTLAEAGFEVLAVGRRAAPLAELRASGAIEPVAVDLTAVDGPARIAAAVGERRLEVLVHGAGVFPRGRITDLTRADWHAAIATNVLARLELVLALRSALAGGRVLFIGSDAAATPRAGGAAYSVSKAASEMLWRCLGTELGAEIAFAIAKPGLVATAMLDESLRAPRAAFPAGDVYAAMRARGETIAARTVARFFRFLLLETSREEFASGIWDIRTAAHHPRWLTGPLYIPRGSGRGTLC